MRRFLCIAACIWLMGAASVGTAPRNIENLQVGGGVSDADGGVSADAQGNVDVGGTLRVMDNELVSMGTDADFSWKFDTVTSRLQLLDADSNVLGYWSDEGTTGKLVITSSVAAPLLNLAHGSAPGSPANGDVWTTTSGVYARINGATVGPLIGTAGVPWATPGTIGSGTPNTGAFTTLSATGQITSTQATGSAPFVIASTTKVANLDVDKVDGGDWAAPAAIGSGTPAAATFTSVDSNQASGSQFATPTAPVLFAGASTGFTMGHASGANIINGASLTFIGGSFPTLSIEGTSGASSSRIYIKRGATTNTSYVGFYTGGAAKWWVGQRADANNEFIIGETFNGAGHLTITPTTGLVTLGGPLAVNGNTKLGDASTDKLAVAGATVPTNFTTAHQGSMYVFKGSTGAWLSALDYSSTNADIAVWSETTNARFIQGQDVTNNTLYSWVYDATPANAYARINNPSAQPLQIQESGGLIKAGTSLRTWNEATGYILGAAINPDSVTDTQLSDVATAGTYNGVTITTAGRVTAAKNGSVNLPLSDGAIAENTPALGTDSSRKGWAFDAASNETVDFATTVPWTADGATTVSVYINWHAAATTNECYWSVDVATVADGAAISFVGALTVEDTVAASTNRNNIAAFTPFTVTTAGGQLLIVRVRRLADEGADDMAGDAFLDAVQVRY